MSMRESFARLPAALLLLSAPTVFGADATSVALVGGQAVTDADLVRRISKIPDFQRAALGDTPDKLKRRVLETLVIPEVLYSLEGERLNLALRPIVRERQREILRQAMDHEVRRQSDSQAPVTPEDIRSYFEANRARFETPKRLRIWRILTDDQVLAKKIIEESKGVDGVQRWSQFARDSSLDKATHLRNGDLGFVHPDGTTETPTLRVDAVLFASADHLNDGELAKEPIKEGSHWAVLWRRGSTPAITRTVAQEEGSIRQVLERQRQDKARLELLSSLRAKYVTVSNESLLDNLHFESDLAPSRPMMPRVPHAPAAGSTPPETTERGTR